MKKILLLLVIGFAMAGCSTVKPVADKNLRHCKREIISTWHVYLSIWHAYFRCRRQNLCLKKQ